MKPDNVKIVQIWGDKIEYKSRSEGGYFETVRKYNVLGLGDDGMVYAWNRHYVSQNHTELGWKLYDLS